jgi:hypothetical protein
MESGCFGHAAQAGALREFNRCPRPGVRVLLRGLELPVE